MKNVFLYENVVYKWKIIFLYTKMYFWMKNYISVWKCIFVWNMYFCMKMYFVWKIFFLRKSFCMKNILSPNSGASLPEGRFYACVAMYILVDHGHAQRLSGWLIGSWLNVDSRLVRDWKSDRSQVRVSSCLRLDPPSRSLLVSSLPAA